MLIEKIKKSGAVTRQLVLIKIIGVISISICKVARLIDQSIKIVHRPFEVSQDTLYGILISRIIV